MEMTIKQTFQKIYRYALDRLLLLPVPQDHALIL